MYDNNLTREDIDLIKEMINYCSSTLVYSENVSKQGLPTFNDYLEKVGKESKDCWDLGDLYVRFVKTVRDNKKEDILTK